MKASIMSWVGYKLVTPVTKLPERFNEAQLSGMRPQHFRFSARSKLEARQTHLV